MSTNKLISKYDNYFRKDGVNKKWICNIKISAEECGALIAITGNSSGWSRHLESHHKEIYQKLNSSDKAQPTIKQKLISKEVYNSFMGVTCHYVNDLFQVK